MATKSDDNIDFGFISFEHDEVEEVAELTGFDFNEREYLVNDEGKTVKCDCCDEPIKKRNLGSILPGSRIVYCDNPICFTKYISKHLE